jgi:hypothetical protein
MSLIRCPECGREVSSSASACPECGYPVMTGTPSVPHSAAKQPRDYTWVKTSLSIAARIFLGVFIAAVGGEEEDSVAAIIGGSIIAASAFPTWYRAKIAQLKSRGSGSELITSVEDRLIEFERSQQDQMDRLEQLHSGQLADLEERLDFAERMLTKQKEQIGPG